MSILLLTGPPACGKNTIGAQLGKHLERCAAIDTDAVRRMVVQPQRLPWEGEEGHRQSLLGIENACALARNFDREGFKVVISDALTSSSLAHYKERLAPLQVQTILILPSKEEITSRLLSRPDYLSRGQVDLLYSQQESFTDYDDLLDNTAFSMKQTLDWMLERWPEPTNK